MAEAGRTLGTYLHLARASHSRRQPMGRDKLLILAGVQAEEMGLDTISALCRHKILAHNARHLVGQWLTLNDALADDEFQMYLKQLRRRYSREKTEHMLHALGIELGREREAYFSDLEYAAALLDTTPEAIADIVALDPRGSANGKSGGRSTDPQSAGRAQSDAAPARRVLNLLIVWWPLAIAAVLLAVLLAAVTATVWRAPGN